MKKKLHESKATIFDVARQAGVSIKTVSRVVNNEPNVRQETRDKVLQAVNGLGYKPDAAARSLSSKRSWVVGLVYENPHEFSYMKDVLNGAFRVCEKREYSLLLRPLSLPDPEIVRHVREFITQARVEGVILPAPMGDFPELLNLLQELGLPFAAISSREPAPGGINIYCKEQEAVFSLTEFLIARGHRAIGFIKGHPDHSASIKRFAGYRQALSKHGLKHAPGLVRQGYFDFDSGKALAGELLNLKAPPSAIIAGNDDMAAGVVLEAHEKGLSMPGELSVAGFDDTPIASHIWPALTTVRQPIEKMAEAAAGLLIDRLDGKEPRPPEEPFDCEIIIRQSTA